MSRFIGAEFELGASRSGGKTNEIITSSTPGEAGRRLIFILLEKCVRAEFQPTNVNDGDDDHGGSGVEGVINNFTPGSVRPEIRGRCSFGAPGEGYAPRSIELVCFVDGARRSRHDQHANGVFHTIPTPFLDSLL